MNEVAEKNETTTDLTEVSTPSEQVSETQQNDAPDEYEKRLNELNQRERDVNLKEYLADKKMPAELFKELDGFDFEQSKKILDIVSKHSKALSVQMAEERFKQNGYEPTPNNTGVSVKEYGEMSIKERIALKESNPELYENLLSAYRSKIGG